MADPTSNDPPLHHRHDEKLDYTTEHTAASPEHVRREEYVDNDDKALPSDSNTSLFVSIGAAVVAILAIVVTFAIDADLVGFIISVAALVMGIVAVAMAYGDARASVVTPAIVTVACVIVSVLCLMDLLDVEDRTPRAVGGNADNDVLVGDGDTPLVDEPNEIGD